MLSLKPQLDLVLTNQIFSILTNYTLSIDKFYTKWVHEHFLTPSFFCCRSFCSLSNKEISDKGACALSAALQVNQSLQELK